MVFDKIQDGREWFLDFKPIQGSVSQMYRDNIEFKPDFGDWFLFRHIKPIDGWNGDDVMSRPILAMFVDWDIWDQALVIRFVENRRAWEYSQKYKVVYEEKTYEWTYLHQPIQVQDIQFWTDDINILGFWNKKPSIKELKQALNEQL